MDTARYQFEAPMPAVHNSKKSTYKIWADNELLQSGTVIRTPQALHSYADYVDTKMEQVIRVG